MCIYTVYYTIRTRAQLDKKYQWKRTSQESEMVTYKHVTEVIMNRCVIHQAYQIYLYIFHSASVYS